MMDSGSKIRRMVTVFKNGQMDKNMTVSGKIIICMVKELSDKKMVVFTKVTSCLVWNMVKEYTNGLMEVDLKVALLMESKMD